MMKSPHKIKSSQQMSVDAAGESDPAPPRKTLSLPKSEPLGDGQKPPAPKTERGRKKADRLALERAEDEGMYLLDE